MKRAERQHLRENELQRLAMLARRLPGAKARVTGGAPRSGSCRAGRRSPAGHFVWRATRAVARARSARRSDGRAGRAGGSAGDAGGRRQLPDRAHADAGGRDEVQGWPPTPTRPLTPGSTPGIRRQSIRSPLATSPRRRPPTRRSFDGKADSLHGQMGRLWSGRYVQALAGQKR